MSASRILVPVDGSPESVRALKFAARRRGAGKGVEVLLLNVQQPLPASRFVTRAMIADHHARMAEEALKPVRALLPKLNVEATVYIETGDPGREIAQFARSRRCGEIVMGTRGLGRVAGLLLGSTATKVVHLASVPVTLVK